MNVLLLFSHIFLYPHTQTRISNYTRKISTWITNSIHRFLLNQVTKPPMPSNFPEITIYFTLEQVMVNQNYHHLRPIFLFLSHERVHFEAFLLVLLAFHFEFVALQLKALDLQLCPLNVGFVLQEVHLMLVGSKKVETNDNQ